MPLQFSKFPKYPSPLPIVFDIPQIPLLPPSLHSRIKEKEDKKGKDFSVI